MWNKSGCITLLSRPTIIFSMMLLGLPVLAACSLNTSFSAATETERLITPALFILVVLY